MYVHNKHLDLFIDTYKFSAYLGYAHKNAVMLQFDIGQTCIPNINFWNSILRGTLEDNTQ